MSELERVVAATQSETTTSGQASSAARTPVGSGRLTAGLVAMIQTRLDLRRRATRRTARPPSARAWWRARRLPEAAHAVAGGGSSKSICAASWLARPPTSRPPIALGCPVSENGPMPGRPMRPVSKMAVEDRVDLVGRRSWIG